MKTPGNYLRTLLPLLLAGIISLNLTAQTGTAFRHNTARYYYSGNDDDEPLTHLRVYGGMVFDLMSSLGEVKNYYFYGKARLLIHDWVLLDGSAFYNPGGISSVQNYQPATYYNAHLTVGKQMGFTAGIEWGDRYFTTPKDSNNYNTGYYGFTNTDNGKTKYFKSAQLKQNMTACCFGFSFMVLSRKESFWREKGNPLSIIDFTIEGMYAPQISYDKVLQVSPYGVWAAQDYSMNALTVKHWGFRLVAECGGSAKMSFHQEIGIRPGISPVQSHDKGQMKARIYISMGASFCLDADGAKFRKWRENRNSAYID